ncbi:MAG TPA: TolC family protein [Candidatus Binataceae bacterium]|nr:TolC family protein [Candidatus Binataceae bacterium]
MAIVFAALGRPALAAPLTLQEAIGRALQYAPSVEAADAASELDSARVAEARAPLFPSLFGVGEYNQAPGYDQTITNGGLTLGELALNYTAYDGGRRTDQVRAARYAAQAAAYGIDAARAQIVYDTTVAYFELMRARETVNELSSNLARLGRYLNVIESLERSGRAIASDVLKLRATRDASDLSFAAAGQAAQQASIALGSLIGEPENADLQITEVSAISPLPSGDLSRNPQLVAATRQIDSARMAVMAAEAERAPNLKIALTAGWEGINPPKTFGHHLGASYDGAISVPLFQGGLVRSHIDQAKASEQAAIAQRRLSELTLTRDLAAARSRYDSSLQQLAIVTRSRQTADDSFALAWTRFLGGGNVTLLEVIDAYEQAENLRVERFAQEFNARQSAAQAKLILGIVQ